MKIQTNPIRYKTINTSQTFGNQHKTTLSEIEMGGTDSFFTESENISHYTKSNKNLLRSIIYKKPMAVSDAFFKLSTTKDRYLADQMLIRLHTPEQLYNIGTQLIRSSDIANIQVKELVGVGNFAFAFETTDSKILKISDGNHFPFDRTPADFDLPIEKQGNFGSERKFYYYIEERVSQDNLPQEELRALVNRIEAEGYLMRDHLRGYAMDYSRNKNEQQIKASQFGRARDGKIYLIDPGCAQETELVSRSYFKKLGATLRKLSRKS